MIDLDQCLFFIAIFDQYFIEKSKSETGTTETEGSPMLSRKERHMIFKSKIKKVMRKCSQQDFSVVKSTKNIKNPLFNFKDIDIE